MNVKAMLLDTLKTERRVTRDTIDTIPEADIRYQPVAAQMSFGAQALHIISCQETLLEAFQGGGWKWERGTTLENFPTKARILERFDAMHAAELAYYENLEPEQFARLIQTSWGPAEPVLQLAVSFLAHEAHHRGQLIVYLRLKGLTPPRY